jgi:hypothetical protein
MSYQAAANLPYLAGEKTECEHDTEQHSQADKTDQQGVVIVDNPIVHDAAESVLCRI